MTNGIEVKEEQVEQQSDAEATNAEESVTETDKKQEKRGTHESHDYHVHEQKTVTIVKKVPVPYPVEKHIPVPVEKIVHYPVKVGVPKPYPVYKTVHYPVKKIIKVPVHIPQRRFFHTNFLIIKKWFSDLRENESTTFERNFFFFSKKKCDILEDLSKNRHSSINRQQYWLKREKNNEKRAGRRGRKKNISGTSILWNEIDRNSYRRYCSFCRSDLIFFVISPSTPSSSL